MKYYQYETNENVDKIPYDKEPILRQTSYKKQKSSPVASSKALVLVVCFLVVMNVILGGLIVSFLSNSKNDQINNTTINLTAPAGEGIDVSAVASKAKLSVVSIHCGVEKSGSALAYAEFYNEPESMGSGVIFKMDKTNSIAYISTCYHVVQNQKNIYVLLYDSFKPIQAKLIHYSSVYDIAVLEISLDTDSENAGEIKVSSAREAEVADSAYLLEGDGVVAIGNPLGAGISVTRGIVSKTVEIVKIDGFERRVLRTDTAINGGNSGGGLFNLQGQLIGIVNAKAIDNPYKDSYIDNVAYAIPSNVAISLANNILRNKTPLKAVIGVGLMTESSGVKLDVVQGTYIPTQKVIVSTIDENIVKPGTFKVSDQIESFSYGNTVVNVINTYSFDDYSFDLSKGEQVTFTVIRTNPDTGKQERVTFTITISQTVPADKQQWY